jgi:dTDP-glucose 4,6-dehydratase
VEVAALVLELCGRPASLKHFVQDRPGHDYRYALDPTRIQRLGWRPSHSFRVGMEATVAWYKTHEAWWKPRKSADFWQFYQKNYRGLPADAIPT